jgi:hypothetical protein
MPERAGGKMKTRAVGRTVGQAIAAVLLLTARSPVRLSAQTPRDTQPPAAAAPRDTSHLVGPVGALWRSLLLPGWGQAVTGRNVTGAIFGIWEGTTMYMTLKAQQEANYFKESNSPNLHAKRQEVQDWLVLWGFNHLFAGAEAFVAAHLRDFPKDLKFQAVPRGLGVSFPLRHP